MSKSFWNVELFLVFFSKFSNEKAKEKLGFKNRNMKETIKDTVEWINKK